MRDTRMVLRCQPQITIDGVSTDLSLHVLTIKAQVVESFEIMCAAIHEDIQTAEGSAAATLEAIERIERGASPSEELGGNAWYTYLSPERVWFEGQYSQGEGGAVSLAQYKLAVQTYVRFLADPEAKLIVVPFPDA
jgi:hypothetical protein